ncbi:hypothetical protein KAU45_11460, partial [bacterium]|nr:hypothetical protein [bacterium]
TGRGLGDCAPRKDKDGNIIEPLRGLGRGGLPWGGGRGRGWGGGWGGGWGRGMGRGRGLGVRYAAEPPEPKAEGSDEG